MNERKKHVRGGSHNNKNIQYPVIVEVENDDDEEDEEAVIHNNL